MSPAPADFLKRLIDGRTDPLGVNAPSSSGIYGIFRARDSVLPTVAGTPTDLLYIGKSRNLSQRQFDTHFTSGQTGFSTLRRSLGALLRDELALTPRPRGSGSSETNFRCYRFDDGGEERLTDWMRRNLDVAVVAVTGEDHIEKDVIALACPPLNLTSCSNPGAAELKELRRTCVEAARDYRQRD